MRLLFYLSLLTALAGRPSISLPSTSAEMVYLCKSSAAYAFHQTVKCRGLSRCSHPIIKVSRAEAVERYGRKACQLCY